MEPRRRPSLSLQFSLRTLLFLMLLAGPLGSWGWTRWQAWKEYQIQLEARQLREKALAAELAQMRSIYAQNIQAILRAQAALQSGDELKANSNAQAANVGRSINLSVDKYPRVRLLLETSELSYDTMSAATEAPKP